MFRDSVPCTAVRRRGVAGAKYFWTGLPPRSTRVHIHLVWRWTC